MSFIEKSIQVAKEDQPTSPGKKKRPAPKPRIKRRQNRSAPDIKWTSEKARELLGESNDDPMFISQFKQLKRAIIQSAFGPLADSDAKMILVTSPLANAGKTFISMNLARALAQERDQKVLLIDADNIKASLSTVLDLRENVGYFDIMDNPDLRIQDAIMPTEIESLEILPTGGKYSDSAEILNSQRCKDLMQRLAAADPNQLIILDAPPLLATPDTAALTHFAGQTLLVVEAGRTKQSELDSALEYFDEQDNVGLILNKAPKISNSHYGGYYRLYRPDEDE